MSYFNKDIQFIDFSKLRDFSDEWLYRLLADVASKKNVFSLDYNGESEKNLWKNRETSHVEAMREIVQSILEQRQDNNYDSVLLNCAITLKLNGATPHLFLAFYEDHGIPESSILSLRDPFSKALNKMLSSSFLTPVTENLYFSEERSDQQSVIVNHYRNVTGILCDELDLDRLDIVYRSRLKARADCSIKGIMRIGPRALVKGSGSIIHNSGHEVTHHFQHWKFAWEGSVERDGLVPFNSENQISYSKYKVGKRYALQAIETHSESGGELLKRSAFLVINGANPRTAIKDAWDMLESPERKETITHYKGRIYPALVVS